MVIAGRPPRAPSALIRVACLCLCSVAVSAAEAPPAPAAGTVPAPGTALQPAPGNTGAVAHCLPSGDGYLRAHIAGAIEAHIDWSDKGTRCEGEPKDTPPGVRLSFERIGHGDSNLLFVFGLTGVREGRPAREVGTNLTVIAQGTDRIYGTLGDSRCTVDSLNQKRLGASKAYRVEARGFCTQPAHAVRGDGAVLVSTFEFAGLVNYDSAPETDLKNLIPKAMTPVH